MDTVTLIDERYKLRREASENPRTHLGASLIGRECSRQLWYTFRWAKQPDFSGRMYRLFDRGHREEDTLANLLRMAGVEVHTVDTNGEQFRVKDGHFGGSMDGCGRGFPEDPEAWHVLEFKTHNDKSFKRLQKVGVVEAKPEHAAQMQVYMHYTGMPKACYMAVNKNDDDLHVEFLDYNESFARMLINKAMGIIHTDTPPERIGGPDWFVCKWCDFRAICHQGEPMDKNCRTCEMSEPLTYDAEWACAEGEPMGDMTEEKTCHSMIKG